MSFGHKHYVPILKGKPGELKALSKLDNPIWRTVTPLMELPPVPLVWPDDGEPYQGISTRQHVEKVASDMVKCLPPNIAIFIDCKLLADAAPIENGEQPIEAFLSITEKAFRAIPVTAFHRSLESSIAVKKNVQQYNCGCCLRLRGSDLNPLTLQKNMDEFLKFIGAKVDQIDLILDLGPIDKADVADTHRQLPSHFKRIPFLGKWRSVTVAGSTLPQDLNDIKAFTRGNKVRGEWGMWLSLVAPESGVSRLPSYGDYAATYPILTTINPKFISSTPTIKYTTKSGWEIARGKAIPKKKKRKPGEELPKVPKDPVPKLEVQYPRLAKMIIESTGWRDPEFSWGSKRISECFSKRLDKIKATGGAADWIAVATSHHITTVVEQLSNLT